MPSHNTMMYLTTLIFTLLFSHIARAMPACDDVASPQDMYDIYDNEQLVLAPYKATLNQTYDNPNGNTTRVACSDGKYGLASKYPQFKDFITFPHIGGAFDTRRNTHECGKCWQLMNWKNGRWIIFTAIADTGGGFSIGQKSLIALGGSVAAGSFDVEAIAVDRSFCGT
jgi:hypothetical protein